MAYRFNPPPNWPVNEPGWTPPPGWQPDPSWGPAPDGWNFWVSEADAPATAPEGAPAPEQPAGTEQSAPAPLAEDSTDQVERPVTRVVQEHRAGVRGEHAGQAVQQRALAGAGRSHDGDGLPGPQLDADAGQGDGGSVGLGQAPSGEGRARPGGLRPRGRGRTVQVGVVSHGSTVGGATRRRRPLMVGSGCAGRTTTVVRAAPGKGPVRPSRGMVYSET